MARLLQFDHRVRADVAGSACNENVHRGIIANNGRKVIAHKITLTDGQETARETTGNQLLWDEHLLVTITPSIAR